MFYIHTFISIYILILRPALSQLSKINIAFLFPVVDFLNFIFNYGIRAKVISNEVPKNENVNLWKGVRLTA